MAEIDVPGLSDDSVHTHIGSFAQLVKSYHADPAFRSRIESDPVGTFHEYGINLPSSIGVEVHANDDRTMYVVFPPDPNVELSEELLETVAGGTTVGSAGSAMTLSTLVCSCAPSTASTLSSSGTASTF